ncbi:MAG: hypothetical protein ABL993_08400 [Vicinamibacterales bacterium]
MASVDSCAIGPGEQTRHHIELAEEASDYLVGVSVGAEPIELGHHLGEGLLDVADGTL